MGEVPKENSTDSHLDINSANEPPPLHPAEKILATLTTVSYRAGELQSYLDSVCEALLELMGTGLSAITLYRYGTKKVLATKPESDCLSCGSMDIHGQLSTHVLNTNTILTVENALSNTQYGSPPEGFCSYMGVPLRSPGGEVVGTLCYFDKKARQFTDREEQTAELFAERIAIALDNYDLFQKLGEYSDSLELQVQERSEQLLKAHEELAQKEKLAALGEFASHITHEIRNPLTTIRLTLEYIKKNPERSPEKRLELGIGEVSRLERLLNELLLYAKPIEVNAGPLELSGFCQDFISTFDSIAKERRQTLKLLTDTPVTVMADRDKLTQVILNLVRNACEAADPEDTITLRLGKTDTVGRVSVHNFGNTIPADKLPIITEPFVSCRANGSGLGLAIVESLQKSQGGNVSFTSSVSDGTVVEIDLPLAPL